MPKQHRWTIKRNIELATNNINRAIDNIVIIGSEFEGIHPEHYQAFCLIVINLNRIKQTITELKDLI